MSLFKQRESRVPDKFETLTGDRFDTPARKLASAFQPTPEIADIAARDRWAQSFAAESAQSSAETAAITADCVSVVPADVRQQLAALEAQIQNLRDDEQATLAALDDHRLTAPDARSERQHRRRRAELEDAAADVHIAIEDARVQHKAIVEPYQGAVRARYHQHSQRAAEALSAVEEAAQRQITQARAAAGRTAAALTALENDGWL